MMVASMLRANTVWAGDFYSNPRNLAWQPMVQRGDDSIRLDLRINFYPDHNIKFWATVFPEIKEEFMDEEDVEKDSRTYLVGEFGPGLMGLIRSIIVYDLSYKYMYHISFYCEEENINNLISEQERETDISIPDLADELIVDQNIVLGEPFQIEWDNPDYTNDCTIEIMLLRPNITSAGSIGMAYASTVIGRVSGDKKSFTTTLTKEMLGTFIAKNSLYGTMTDYFYRIWIMAKRTKVGQEETLKGMESNAVTILDFNEPMVRWPKEP
jgi:hypothetical protein